MNAPEEMTLADLVRVVLDPAQTDNSKRLAMSIAYHKGMNDGLVMATDSAERMRPKLVRFSR